MKKLLLITSYIIVFIIAYLTLKLEKENIKIEKINKDIKIEITNLQNQITEIVKKNSQAVVSIVITKNLKIYIENPFDFFWWYVEERKEKIWWWSWIIVSKDWYIITNKHVIQDINADYSVVLNNWNIYPVKRIRIDPILDIAVLKIDPKEDLNVVQIRSIYENIEIWQFVIAIWYALAEYANTVTFWIISWMWRNLDQTNQSLYIWLYQTDAAINPWNSWWPLLNIDWKVVWINTAISAIWQWIWFAIPITNEFKNAILKSIKIYWNIKKPFIWIYFNEKKQTVIEKIVPNSPAEKAWLKVGDIINKINWIQINEKHPLLYVLYTFLPWDTIEIEIIRDWKLIKTNLTLEEFKL